jgi:cysteine desulfurase/selenocysteine lyase
MSNVLGTVVDVKEICRVAQEKNIATLIDGSQSSVHLPINVKELGCDFFVITGHKLYGHHHLAHYMLAKSAMKK